MYNQDRIYFYGVRFMSWPLPITLQGEHATLVPLSQAYLEDLIAAVKDGELWKLWYTMIPEPSKMKEEITRRLDLQQKGSMLPWVVIDNKNAKIVGMTTYMNIDAKNRRVEIGSTWYSKKVQRTAINTECKLMLLSHAFESLNCIAVEFRTSFFNFASRKAIERLGAKPDGILRNHIVMPNGTTRDTCVYSILPNEWPGVKANLLWKLS